MDFGKEIDRLYRLISDGDKRFNGLNEKVDTLRELSDIHGRQIRKFDWDITNLHKFDDRNFKRIGEAFDKVDELPKRWQMAVDSLRNSIEDNRKAIEVITGRAEQAEIDALKVRLRDAINEGQDLFYENKRLADQHNSVVMSFNDMQAERDKWRELAEVNGVLVDRYRAAVDMGDE